MATLSQTGSQPGSAIWSAVFLTPGRKLRLFQEHDVQKQWWSLEETRFCRKCERLFIGRDIQVFENGRGGMRFHCPTERCDGGFADWEYPRLHL